MRLVYDIAGSGRVTRLASFLDEGAPNEVEFPDASVPTADRLRQALVATPGRYRVTGPAGSRQLLDNGVAVATESGTDGVAAAIAALSDTYVKVANVAATDAATITFDLTSGTHHSVTLGGNRTLAVAGDALHPRFSVTLNTGAGGRSVTWWAGITWAAGSAPTLTTAANKEDTFTFIRRGAGDYVGRVVDQGVAGPPAVPAVPTSITAVAGNTTAAVSFTPGSNGGAARDGCRITPFIGSTAQTAQVFATTATTQTVTGLTNGTAYTFKVEDHNPVGYSTPLSAASNSVTPAAATAPGAPAIGTASASDGTATGTWTAPGSDGGSAVTGYDWQIVLASDGTTVVASASIGVALTTGAVTATNGTAVKFRSRAKNIVGPGAWSALSNAVTPAAAAGASDTFNRPDGALGTSSGGQTWVIGGGTWTVDTNRATAADASGVVAVVETGLADGTGQVTCIRSDNAVGAEQQLVFRYIDASNYLFIQIQGAGAGSASRICKKDSGTISVLADGAGGTWSVAAPATIEAVVTGSAIAYHVNGTLNVSYTLTGPEQAKYGAATKWGLGGGWLNFVGGWFDDFSVIA